jgi:hypothetical protein
VECGQLDMWPGEVGRRRGWEGDSSHRGARPDPRIRKAVSCRSDGLWLPRGWTLNEIPPTPDDNWNTVCPLAAVSGGKATCRRVESRQARPRRRHCSGTEAESAGEAPAWAPSTAAFACPVALHGAPSARHRTPAGGRPPRHSVAQCICSGSAPHAGTRLHPRRMCRRGGGRSRPRHGDVGRAGGRGGGWSGCWCHVSLKKGKR